MRFFCDKILLMKEISNNELLEVIVKHFNKLKEKIDINREKIDRNSNQITGLGNRLDNEIVRNTDKQFSTDIRIKKLRGCSL